MDSPDGGAAPAGTLPENADCVNNTDGDTCAAGLICVAAQDADGNPLYGGCKKPCTTNAECGTRVCAVGFLGDGTGVCATPKGPGQTGCDFWEVSDSFCFNPNEPASTEAVLECLDGTCGYICQVEGRTDPALACPAGQSCGDTFDAYGGFGANLAICETRPPSPEFGPCTATSECVMGLECQANLCLKTCTTPDTQSTCAAGQLCITLRSGANVCITQAPRFDECNLDYVLAVCGPGQDCQTGFVAADGGIPFGASACQIPCDPGVSNACGAGEACLVSSNAFVSVQGAPDASVSCTAGSNTGCNTDAGFTCTSLGNGTSQCARELYACGTPVGPADLRLTPDGGSRITPNMFCNLGSSFFNADGGVALSGGRFCQLYNNLNPAPEVFCDDEFPPPGDDGLGVCNVFCDTPPSGTTPPGTTACPTGTTCQVVNNGYAFAVRPTANTTVSCTTGGTQCAAYAGSRCINFGGTTGNVCAWPARQCTPTTP